jgi:tRNA-Thr(GGU) m(6)t(6)A37 methyltransferase TsaA
MSSQQEIVLKSVGVVRTNAIGNEVRDKTRTSKIIMRSDLAEALDGVVGFSHFFVLFLLHEVPESQQEILRIHPRGRKDMPLLGVFATRTMFRPNPVGLTLVELVEVEGNVLTVRGLDAFDGTPVIDIKPFDPWDNAENAKVPEWWIQLKKEKEQKS